MSARAEDILTAIAAAGACLFACTVLFAMGAAFVAFGLWMLRLAGLVA